MPASHLGSSSPLASTTSEKSAAVAAEILADRARASDARLTGQLSFAQREGRRTIGVKITLETSSITGD